MNKSDLIIKIANLNPSIYQKDANKIVNVFFGTITKALSRNERVELRGFGVFDVKKRKARIARNPKNNEKIYVKEKYSLLFKVSKEWSKKINDEK